MSNEPDKDFQPQTASELDALQRADKAAAEVKDEEKVDKPEQDKDEDG